ncbi:MAG: sensor histidine kinase [Saprospiraceae bacterium]
MIFALILIYIGPKDWTNIHLILWSFSNTIIYASLAYFNLFYLFPRFLRNGSFILYLSSIIGISLIATPLQIVINHTFCTIEIGGCSTWITDQKFHFISMLIVSSLSTLARIPLDWLKVQHEKQTLQTKNIESELQFLKNQINPHFLFNTLNNLYALTLKKSDYAPELVLKLSDMLRYMLYECNEEKVSLSKEIHYIKNYLDLEKIRLSQQPEIEFDIDGDPDTIKVAPLLFIPFLENSFKHGLKYNSDKSFIHIQFRINETLHFSILNSKSPANPGWTKPNKVGGIGLSNVKKRLELIYPKRHQLIIDDQPDFFEVTLNITI